MYETSCSYDSVRPTHIKSQAMHICLAREKYYAAAETAICQLPTRTLHASIISD